MARGTSKRGIVIEPVSRPLEEIYPIPYQVIGAPQWLREAFPEGTLRPHEVIEVSRDEDTKEARDWLLSQPVLGVDSEGTGVDKRAGLDPLHPTSRLTLLQIGTPARVFLIQPELIPLFRPVLESKDILHILHNAVYDFKFLLIKYKIHLERVFDTMLTEQLLTSGLLGVSVSLEEVARKHPPHRIISKEVRKQFIEFNGVFDQAMVYYAARDIDLMFPIMKAQVELLKKWNMGKVAQDEFNVIPCTAMMELGGVHLDIPTLRLALSYWDARGKELEAAILEVYDREIRKKGETTLFLLPEMTEFFDLNSPSQKLAALRRLGLEIEDTRRDTIEELDHPIAPLLAEYSEVMKVKTTYGESLIHRVSQDTGRLYPEFNQLGSGDLEAKKGRSKKETIATGRYSSDFQQLPRPVERYALVVGEELAKVQEQFRQELSQLRREAVHA